MDFKGIAVAWMRKARLTPFRNIKIHIKWDGLGKAISVCKFTKQGGLSSSYLFNILFNLLDVRTE